MISPLKLFSQKNGDTTRIWQGTVSVCRRLNLTEFPQFGAFSSSLGLEITNLQ